MAGFSRKGRQCVTGHSSVLLDWKTFRNKIIPVGTTYSLHNKTVLKFLDRSYLSTRYRLIKLVIGVYNCSIVYDGEINFDIIYSILRSHSKTGEAALVFGYCHSSYINRTFYFWNGFKKILFSLQYFKALENDNIQLKVFKMTEFNFFGFVLCLCAAATGKILDEF